MRILYIPKPVSLFTPIIYGLLYNWYAVTDTRNITNTGWHIASNSEWDTLISYIGDYTDSGGKLKETGLTHWFNPNVGATNEVSFNGRGSGQRGSGYPWDETFALFANLKGQLVIHTSDYTDDDNSNSIRIEAGVSYISLNTYWNKKFGTSIRPIKDSTSLTHGQTGTYTDPSGFIYPTICIGTQEWVAMNIITQHYRNNDAIPEVTENAAWAALTTPGLCAYNNDWSNV